MSLKRHVWESRETISFCPDTLPRGLASPNFELVSQLAWHDSGHESFMILSGLVPVLSKPQHLWAWSGAYISGGFEVLGSV